MNFTGLRAKNVWGCRFEKGSKCTQQFKTVDLYQAKPVSTGWFPVSTVAHFTSLSNYLESVPPRDRSVSANYSHFDVFKHTGSFTRSQAFGIIKCHLPKPFRVCEIRGLHKIFLRQSAESGRSSLASSAGSAKAMRVSGSSRRRAESGCSSSRW